MAKNATYVSDKSIQEMVYILSEVIEHRILAQIEDSSHFALMLDETTDCTVTEQLAIHGRYITKCGQLKSCYLKTIDVLLPEIEGILEPTDLAPHINMSATTIKNRVCEYVKEAKISTDKLRGIGTDGASTMIGRHNGVVAQLKAVTPSAIGVHCAAHRLNLASSQAGDSIPYIKKFNTILLFLIIVQCGWEVCMQFKIYLKKGESY